MNREVWSGRVKEKSNVKQRQCKVRSRQGLEGVDKRRARQWSERPSRLAGRGSRPGMKVDWGGSMVSWRPRTRDVQVQPRCKVIERGRIRGPAFWTPSSCCSSRNQVLSGLVSCPAALRTARNRQVVAEWSAAPRTVPSYALDQTSLNGDAAMYFDHFP